MQETSLRTRLLVGDGLTGLTPVLPKWRRGNVRWKNGSMMLNDAKEWLNGDVKFEHLLTRINRNFEMLISNIMKYAGTQS